MSVWREKKERMYLNTVGKAIEQSQRNPTINIYTREGSKNLMEKVGFGSIVSDLSGVREKEKNIL